MIYRPILVFAFSLLIFSCAPSSEEQAQELIAKSIESHQLSQKWEDVSSVKFNKVTRIFDENGTLESESEQWVEFRLKPYFEGRLSWLKDSIQHVANFNGSKMSYQMGANEIQNQGFLKAKRAEIHAAFCDFAQPWRLSDENVHASYEGEKVMEDGRKMEAVRIYFIPDSEGWWFYFDPVSAGIVASELHSKGENSLLEIESYDESTGLKLVKEQRDFRTDDTGKKLHLQAEYLYSDYEVTYE